MEIKICVAGLGYVGLPLAVEFSKHYPVIGFDVKGKRIEELKEGKDISGEVSEERLKNSSVIFTSESSAIKEASFVIVCVPTPVDKVNRPDLAFVRSASELVGKNLKPGAIVVYESTVYPGCTEEVCVPILEKFSGLKCGKDFKVGYSPERINPGDKEHTIDKVIKIVGGMDSGVTEKMAEVYGKITSGIHKASSIKVAEAAKVIENIQRDLNIALMNELSIIFDKIGIKTKDVLEAAGTKWNWHKYNPGLCGGHCIPVDPYYLTYKSQELGYNPEVILAGRRINDGMYKHLVDKIIRKLNDSGKVLKESKVAVLGLTFKENVKDFRNSKAKEVVEELKSYGIKVFGCDPVLGKEVVEKEFGVEYKDLLALKDADGLIIVSPHKVFEEMDWGHFEGKKPFVIDVKSVLDGKKLMDLGFDYSSF